MPDELQTDRRDSVGRGAGVAIAFQLLQLLVVFVTPFVYRAPYDLGLTGLILALMTWGATQFFYLGPLAWWFRRKGRVQCMKGVLIVAGIGLLLNGGCDALVFSLSRT